MIKGKPPRLELIYFSQPLYFVTCGTLYRRALLATEFVHEKFREYCVRGIDREVGVGRYVIMPEHVHLFVRGGPEFNIGLWMRGLKRAMASEPKFWQPGFFDHILRSDESYSEKWNYVRNNPVRAGLVTSADDWPFQNEFVTIDCS